MRQHWPTWGTILLTQENPKNRSHVHRQRRVEHQTQPLWPGRPFRTVRAFLHPHLVSPEATNDGL